MLLDQLPDESDAATLNLEQSSLLSQPPNVVDDNQMMLEARRSIDPELQRLHAESHLKYPSLPLSAGEYVILALRRNTIGLIAIWGVVSILVVLTLALLPIYSLNLDSIAFSLGTKPENIISPPILAIPLLFIDALFILGGLAASRVYSENRLYLTNESIIQYVQAGLFDSQVRQVNLANVEDVSSEQHGPLQQILNYGSIRISTRGHKTIYTFSSLNNPDRAVKAITDAKENVTGNAARFWGRGVDQPGD